MQDQCAVPSGWQVSVVGHNLTIIAMDAQPLEPRTVQSFVFYPGQR
jgi:FtsP/CotA-like multicopper oxidase with cupredoxin domain